MQHARLSGSKAEWFIACSAAPRFQELLGIVDEADEPDYRRDGIAAHAVAAECLRTGLDPWNFIGDERYPFFDKEHVEAVQSYLDFVRERAAGAELLIEHVVDDPDREDFGGTLDVAWKRSEGHALLIDYKHGAGLAVEADCAQLFYYAYGLILKWPELRTMQLGIVQPRAWHKDGPIRIINEPAEQVVGWANDVLHPAMERTKSDGAVFSPGNHCRFCPLKLSCPALVGVSRALAETPTVGAAAVQELTDEQLAHLGTLVKPMEMRLKAVMSEIARRVFAGRTVPGFKVVAKKADRTWTDGSEADAEACAIWGGLALTEPTLKSPAQIDKLDGGKEFTARYAHSPQTGYTVAAEDDKRKEVKVTSIPQALLDKSADEA